MPALVALVALLVELDVAGRGPKDVLVLLEGGLGVGAGVGTDLVTTVHPGVPGLQVHSVSNFTISMRLTFSKTGHLT
jgi:hypothetical protein